MTVPNVVLGKTAVVFVNIPSTLNAGLGLVGATVTANNQVTLRFLNATAGALDPAAATYVIGTVKYKS